MPAGQFISGTDGRVELLTEAGSAIGELPRVKAWGLEASSGLAERGGRVMASNDDGVVAVAAELALTGGLGSNVGYLRAKSAGTAGNSITFDLNSTADGGGGPYPPSAVDSVTVTGTDIVVEWSPTESGLTLAQLRAAIEGDVDAAALVEVIDGEFPDVILSDQDGTLAGGVDGAATQGGPWQNGRAVSRSWSGSVEFEWQESQLIPAALQVDPSKVGETIQVKFYPHDSTSGRVVYSGKARIASASVPSEVEGVIRSTIEFTGNSTLTRSLVS